MSAGTEQAEFPISALPPSLPPLTPLYIHTTQCSLIVLWITRAREGHSYRNRWIVWCAPVSDKSWVTVACVRGREESRRKSRRCFFLAQERWREFRECEGGGGGAYKMEPEAPPPRSWPARFLLKIGSRHQPLTSGKIQVRKKRCAAMYVCRCI